MPVVTVRAFLTGIWLRRVVQVSIIHALTEEPSRNGYTYSHCITPVTPSHNRQPVLHFSSLLAGDEGWRGQDARTRRDASKGDVMSQPDHDRRNRIQLITFRFDCGGKCLVSCMAHTILWLAELSRCSKVVMTVNFPPISSHAKHGNSGDDNPFIVRCVTMLLGSRHTL